MLNGTQRSPTVLVNYLPAFGQSCSFHLSDPFVCLNKVFFFYKKQHFFEYILTRSRALASGRNEFKS